MSDAERRADMLQELSGDLDAMLCKAGTLEYGAVSHALGKFSLKVGRLPMERHRQNIVNCAAYAMRDAVFEHPSEREMLRRFCTLLRGLLEDCENE